MTTEKTLTYYRPPTQSEIKFGHGATHHADFEENDDRAPFRKKDGSLKKWFVSGYDGLRYYRY